MVDAWQPSCVKRSICRPTVRIALTRPAGANQEWRARLQSIGHEVIELPLTTIEIVSEPAIDWSSINFESVVSFFTSVNAVASADFLFPSIFDQLSLSHHVVAIGRVTAQALRSRGVQRVWLPTQPNASTVVAELPFSVGEAVIVGAVTMRPELSEGLTTRGWNVRHLPVYQTVGSPWTPQQVDQAMSADLISLAAPSAVDVLAMSVPVDRRRSLPPVLPVGPTTRRQVERHPWLVLADVDVDLGCLTL